MQKQVKILVVDDESGVRDLLSYTLQKKGYAVKTSHNGEAGIILYGQEAFDLVLVDVHMPVKNGIEVIEEIKKQNPGQLIILFSSHSDRDYVLETRGKELGVFDCIFKPFEISRLMFAVETALKNQRG